MSGAGPGALATPSDGPRMDVPAIVAAVHTLKGGGAKRLQDFLKQHGESTAVASVLRDPWLLVLPGIVDWDTAERWPDPTRINPADSDARLAAATMEGLRRMLLERGHTALPLEHAAQVIAGITGGPVDPPSAAVAMQRLVAARIAQLYDGHLQLTSAAGTEASIASNVRRLLSVPPRVSEAARRIVERELAGARPPLSTEQQEAIRVVLRHRFAVVTGPAGVGKTEVIRALVRICDKLNETVLVGTPTGRAADVLVQRGVRQATTMHSLLGLTPDDTPPLSAAVGSMAPLRAHRLICDEGTMQDLILVERMLASIPNDMSVVMFGDVDQLPPVGPGSPFETFVAAPAVIPVARIEEVRRTQGRLTTNGLKIRQGRWPELDAADMPLTDATWWDTGRVPAAYTRLAQEHPDRPKEHADLFAIALWIRDIVCDILPARLRIPAEEIQVITPQAPGPLGTDLLAGLIREHVNPVRPGQSDSAYWYARRKHRPRVGDRVIALDTFNSIRNGATGTVEGFDHASRTASVRLDGRAEPVAVAGRDLQRFALRYALTVHRTQGSEYEGVVQVLHECIAEPLRTRRNIYTGATRGRRFSGFVASEPAIQAALDNVHGDKKIGTLGRRLLVA